MVANEVELAKQTPYRKLNIIKLAEHNFFEKEGPIVIFYEVKFHYKSILLIRI